jgi:hypothetical protein
MLDTAKMPPADARQVNVVRATRFQLAHRAEAGTATAEDLEALASQEAWLLAQGDELAPITKQGTGVTRYKKRR